MGVSALQHGRAPVLHVPAQSRRAAAARRRSRAVFRPRFGEPRRLASSAGSIGSFQNRRPSGRSSSFTIRFTARAATRCRRPLRRSTLERVLIEHQVDVVFSGHEHLYERMPPQSGVMYFVVGASGAVRTGDLRPSRIRRGVTIAISASCSSRLPATRCTFGR